MDGLPLGVYILKLLLKWILETCGVIVCAISTIYYVATHILWDYFALIGMVFASFYWYRLIIEYILIFGHFLYMISLMSVGIIAIYSNV